ncbi:ELMO domain-containing protein 3 [Alligator sinensis]|uniref:ELMO domain-containing protein 3 n=1 Tax=Alligator sinensis TaxID=38654 RepID=A0A3Q0HDN9_ALLSI|nr:ELMO domain-containing protein 3 [Alligator sinensis]
MRSARGGSAGWSARAVTPRLLDFRGGGSKGMNQRTPDIERSEEQDVFLPAVKFVPISMLKQNGLLQALSEEASGLTEADPSEEVLRAQEEWEALEAIQSGTVDNSASPVTLISFNEALQYFQTADLTECRKRIQPTLQRRGLSAVVHFFLTLQRRGLSAVGHCFCGPPRLHQQLQAERDLAFAIAQCGLDNNEKVHMRILQTIYKKLTGSRFGCPCYGAHWEELGFQGLDPGTDLRGTGMLSLMQVLYFVMDPQTFLLAQDIFKLSQHSMQACPFLYLWVGIYLIVISLREGYSAGLRGEAEVGLSTPVFVPCRECNRRHQVIAVLNDLYVAIFLHLYYTWKTQHKTISDSGFVLKELEAFAKKKPRQLLKYLEAYMSGNTESIMEDGFQHFSASSSTHRLTHYSAGSSSGNKELNFTGVCDLHVEMEGEARLI